MFETVINNEISNTVVKIAQPPDEGNKHLQRIEKMMVTLKDSIEHIRLMPDAHESNSAYVGFTGLIKLTDNDIRTARINPRLIGTDIGCGITAGKLSPSVVKKLGKNDRIDKLISHIKMISPREGDTRKFPLVEESYVKRYMREAQTHADNFADKYNIPKCVYNIDEMCKKLKVSKNNFMNWIGTLGSGNHYVELNQGKEWYLTVHSGSRMMGRKIFDYYVKLCDGDGFLTNDNVIEYMYDIIFCQVYAKMNRHVIIDSCYALLDNDIHDFIETVHNFIHIDNLTICKGASIIGSDIGIISLNMKEGFALCKGLNNSEYNNACAHGCGRETSRSNVDTSNKSLKEFKQLMKDVASVDINKDYIDEAPFAYRNSSNVLQWVKENKLAEIIDICVTVMNVKG